MILCKDKSKFEDQNGEEADDEEAQKKSVTKTIPNNAINKSKTIYFLDAFLPTKRAMDRQQARYGDWRERRIRMQTSRQRSPSKEEACKIREGDAL